MAQTPWRRPAGAPAVPHVWSRFSGRARADGTAPAFWVQDVGEELVEAAVQHMCVHYLPEEQMSAAARHLQDPVSVEDFRGMWRRAMLEQQVSLAVLTEGPAGPRLVGCNVLGVVRPGDAPPQMRGEAARLVFGAVSELERRGQLWERFPAAGAFLTGLGLSVAAEFRGQGLGLQMLRAREPLCRAVGLPFTATVFSGPASQKQAERAGFQLLAQLPYAEYRVHGRPAFPDISWPCAQLRARSFQPESQEQ